MAAEKDAVAEKIVGNYRAAFNKIFQESTDNYAKVCSTYLPEESVETCKEKYADIKKMYSKAHRSEYTDEQRLIGARASELQTISDSSVSAFLDKLDTHNIHYTRNFLGDMSENELARCTAQPGFISNNPDLEKLWGAVSIIGMIITKKEYGYFGFSEDEIRMINSKLQSLIIACHQDSPSYYVEDLRLALAIRAKNEAIKEKEPGLLEKLTEGIFGFFSIRNSSSNKESVQPNRNSQGSSSRDSFIPSSCSSSSLARTSSDLSESTPPSLLKRSLLKS